MKRFTKLVGFMKKNAGRVAVAGAVLLPFSAKAEANPLLTAIQTQLTDIIGQVTAMQVVVFGSAIGIVLGFVVYRLLKGSASKIG